MIDVFAADAKHIFAAKDKYRDWSLTPAVIDAVKSMYQIGTTHPDGVEPADINKYLVTHGFRTTNSFATALHVTLRRLSEMGDGRLLLTKDKYFVRRYKPSPKVLEQK